MGRSAIKQSAQFFLERVDSFLYVGSLAQLLRR